MIIKESYARKIIRILEELKYPDMPKLGDYADELEYLKEAWKYFNDKLFQGKLIEPKFRLFTARLTSDRGKAGSYTPNLDKEYHALQGSLSFGKQYINIPEVFEEILIHEMCHQAVEEIDQYSYNLAQKFKKEAKELYDEDSKYFDWAWKGKLNKSRRAHGKEWKAWARKCGINAGLTVTPNPELDKIRREAYQNKPKSKRSVFSF